MKKLMAIITCISFIMSGCASFKPNKTPDRASSKFKYYQTVEGVTVYLDPYYSPMKTRRVFDNDFKEHELLAVLLIVDVPEENKYSLTRDALTVSDNTGKTFPPIDYKTAGDMVGRSYGFTVMWFFLGGLVCTIPSAIHTASINTKIENDLHDRELNCGVISGKQAMGFIYYDLEPYGDNGAPGEMTANITVENTATNEPLTFSIKFNPYERM